MATVAVLALGTTGCRDAGTTARPSASSAVPAPASSPPAPATSPSLKLKPSSRFTEHHNITGSQVIMIDPQGKKYTRKTMVQMAAGMAAVNEGKGLPSDFCAISYSEGVKGGGTFPLGRDAFMEACQEGVRLAG